MASVKGEGEKGVCGKIPFVFSLNAFKEIIGVMW